jgi:hypothetical protein
MTSIGCDFCAPTCLAYLGRSERVDHDFFISAPKGDHENYDWIQAILKRLVNARIADIEVFKRIKSSDMHMQTEKMSFESLIK